MFSEGVALDRDLRVDGADQRRMTARAIAFCGRYAQTSLRWRSMAGTAARRGSCGGVGGSRSTLNRTGVESNRLVLALHGTEVRLTAILA
jgi:hypothetical protein